MGNQPIKSSKTTTKKKTFFCCLCTSTYDKSPPNDPISSEEEKYCLFQSNRPLTNVIHKFHLKAYLNDYLHRLKHSPQNQTFAQHFSSSTVIYPSNDIHPIFHDLLHLVIIAPPESILPYCSRSIFNTSIIHEQLRAKCYFIPLIDTLIEPLDDQPLKSSCVFVSNDSFQTGSIRIDPENVNKEFLPFVIQSSLSSNLIEKWFNTLILVNQTCSIARRFLMGNPNHITCLLQQQDSSSEKNFIFVALRRSSHSISSDEKFTDGFSPSFLSDIEKLSPESSIHIDYEQYSFALVLSRWPKLLMEKYFTHPQRRSTRKWPNEDQMKMIMQKSLLLTPMSSTDQWRINWDLIEEYLFRLMNESCIFFYLLCQKFFTRTYAQRTLIKHVFLNFSEKYGLPFSKKRVEISELIRKFLEDLSNQVKKKFLPNYFNHQINLLQSDEDYQPWLDHLNRCHHEQIHFSLSSSHSTRSIISPFFFIFTEQLYRNFRRNQSDFSLNDLILLDLHRQLSHDDLLLDQQTLDTIQRNLTAHFECNAELVHRCLNQIRKSQSSLIFHYMWTMFIQYLHTYYNVLWNL